MTELSLRLGFTLLVLLGLGWAVLRVTRGGAHRRGRAVTVLTRQHLTRNSAVAVVQVADRALVLGVTDHGVSLLTETDLDAVREPRPRTDARPGPPTDVPTSPVPDARPGPLAGSALSPQTWKDALRALRERTVRRT
ncbi:MAG: flagellar biosynthetic protein FliO [Dactylosporangium sp.]|nr:flagellar biosynthetic protein FliO [Dactylosporangium sp.]NNJ61283.1 flagellar biosynthetic protein FliO [Dactylosporangium sp.]